jgi:hypothetical protein
MMGEGKTILAVGGAMLVAAMQREGIEIDVVYIDEPVPMPDFKEVRTDLAFKRGKTHPTSFRKSHK